MHTYSTIICVVQNVLLRLVIFNAHLLMQKPNLKSLSFAKNTSFAPKWIICYNSLKFLFEKFNDVIFAIVLNIL